VIHCTAQHLSNSPYNSVRLRSGSTAYHSAKLERIRLLHPSMSCTRCSFRPSTEREFDLMCSLPRWFQCESQQTHWRVRGIVVRCRGRETELSKRHLPRSREKVSKMESLTQDDSGSYHICDVYISLFHSTHVLPVLTRSNILLPRLLARESH
jgi:hypothetical protein